MLRKVSNDILFVSEVEITDPGEVNHYDHSYCATPNLGDNIYQDQALKDDTESQINSVGLQLEPSGKCFYISPAGLQDLIEINSCTVEEVLMQEFEEE